MESLSFLSPLFTLEVVDAAHVPKRQEKKLISLMTKNFKKKEEVIEDPQASKIENRSRFALQFV